MVQENIKIIEFKVPETLREFVAKEIISNPEFGFPFKNIDGNAQQIVNYIVDKLKITGIALSSDRIKNLIPSLVRIIFTIVPFEVNENARAALNKISEEIENKKLFVRHLIIGVNSNKFDVIYLIYIFDDIIPPVKMN